MQPGSEIAPLLDWSRSHTKNDENVCWVGHSPDVERLAAEIMGDGTARIRFAKGAIAAFSFEADINAAPANSAGSQPLNRSAFEEGTNRNGRTAPATY